MNRRGPPAPGGAGTKHVQTVSPDLGVMNMKPVPPVSKESTPPPMAAASVPLDTGPLPSAAVAVAPTLPVTLTTPAPAVIPSVAMQTGSRDGGTAHRARDEQLDAADAALRRGEHAAAAEILAPLARAGVFRAQAMLGRAYEGTSGPNADYFQAYVWYSVAARNGEPSASALRDKVAGKLQPAEIQQAGRLVETLK